MNLRRQLLLVSLLTLVLPWAGCRFISETESALRQGQQQMLLGTARAISDSLAQYGEEFPETEDVNFVFGDQLYGHPLFAAPQLDGYFDDWLLSRDSLRELGGSDGPILFTIGVHDASAYLYLEISDNDVVYASPSNIALDDGPEYADRVSLISSNPPYLEETLVFAAEAPGPVVTYLRTAFGFAPEPRIRAEWQDVPGGYQLEARIPLSMLGTHLGVSVANTSDRLSSGVRSSSYASRVPGAFVAPSADLSAIARDLVQPGTRLIITDRAGWQLTNVGELGQPANGTTVIANWLRVLYNLIVEPGTEAAYADPDASGREQQPYVLAALDNRASASWFRGESDGRAVVAVAEPVTIAGEVVGTLILQQSTDEILSLTNEGLARLMNVTIIATVVVAVGLLGYATWLSRRIRHLSIAAEAALDGGSIHTSLPSGDARDEIGDLSRSFAHVLQQLGDYNDYLRTLASKLSHELRTPLAIVTSSLENLEHETLSDASAGYTARARDGADRLRNILNAMSEANRVEELMKNAEPEYFNLQEVLTSTVRAYTDVYPQRHFEYDGCDGPSAVEGSPELVIQMLDKLVDNAVSFSHEGDEIGIGLTVDGDSLVLSVSNPGPPLPERMRTQLFDSMVSVRTGADRQHLGLGLYIAKLIAEGHGGTIGADNTVSGVRFFVMLPGREY